MIKFSRGMILSLKISTAGRRTTTRGRENLSLIMITKEMADWGQPQPYL
jgi:hypothetical protein